MKIKISIPTLHCKRCEHKWKPKQSEITICPKCKSAYWNKDRKVNVKMNDEENMKNGRKQTKG